MKVKITDVGIQNQKMMGDLLPVIQEVIESGQYIKGSYLTNFEQSFAAYHATIGFEKAALKKFYCIGCNSGTDALILALLAADIKPGDEVITTAVSFYATAEAIARVGAIPVFVDVLEDDNINPGLIRNYITKKTKAIIPVHMHGKAAMMDRINQVAEVHGLIVIEDVAQATGADALDVNGFKVKAGASGHMGCFSFFPTKNLGCIGDGGAVITKDEILYNRLISLREHGSDPGNKDFQLGIGLNSRLDNLQAAVLLKKLPHLNDWNRKRKEIASEYDRLIGETCLKYGVKLASSEGSVFHHYMLYFPDNKSREKVKTKLNELGIEAKVYYPVPVPYQKPYIKQMIQSGFTSIVRYKDTETPSVEFKDIYPNAFKSSRTNLALPLYPEMDQETIEFVSDRFCFALQHAFGDV